jgi:putative restriction endonuclease
MTSTEEFKKLLSNVRTWTRGDKRAPHKPLLLLFALGRIQSGKERVVSFAEAKPILDRLLRTFGTNTTIEAWAPFWHLQSDGLWEVLDAEHLERRTETDGRSPRPKPSALEEHGKGGFPPDVFKLLQHNPDLVSLAVKTILESHFQESYQNDLLNEVGLDLSPRPLKAESGRDPNFPLLVRRAYGFSCAVCGFNPSKDGISVGLEAAHVKAFNHNGPSTIDNGVCLCPIHHKLFDLGLVGLSSERTVLISSRLSGGETVAAMAQDFSGRPIRKPQKGTPEIARKYQEWHFNEVFKKPAIGT